MPLTRGGLEEEAPLAQEARKEKDQWELGAVGTRVAARSGNLR